MKTKDLFESIEDKGIFKAVFMAGMPGAGKSFIAKLLTGGQVNPRLLNIDVGFEHLSKKSGDDPSIPQTWKKHQKQSIGMFKNQLFNYLNGMLPLIIDGTAADPAVLKRRMDVLKAVGYDIAMVWVETEKETAMKRMAHRERKVPKELQVKAHSKLRKAKEFYSNLLGDNFIKVINTEDKKPDLYHAKKRLDKFYLSEVQNPIGRETKSKLLSSGEKYLIPTIYAPEELSMYVTAWYAR